MKESTVTLLEPGDSMPSNDAVVPVGPCFRLLIPTYCPSVFPVLSDADLKRRIEAIPFIPFKKCEHEIR
jgi:hypothetical protein